MNNTPWVEKYRPNDFDTIILDLKNKQIFLNMIDQDIFPNILAHGFPGTGKTTAIINLLSLYYKRKGINSSSMIIHLNASDERGIDIIRNQINTFVTTKHLLFLKEDCLKFVVFDEVDYMTKSAQQALRYLIQISPKNVRFCLMCNYISRIDESLQTEFMKIRFNNLPIEKTFAFLKNICVQENVMIDDSDVYALIRYFNNDVRSMINFLQCNQHFENKDMNLSILNHNDFQCFYQKLLEQETNVETIVNMIYNISKKKNVSPKQFLLQFLHFLLKHNPKFEYSKENLSSIEDIAHTFTLETRYFLQHACIKVQKIIFKYI